MAERKGFKPYLDAAREVVDSIDTSQVDQLRADDPDIIILDVRQADEYFEGAIPGAIHVPRGVLEEAIEARVPQKDIPVIAYCASGIRSVLAARTLAELDYTNVVSLNGGFQLWKDEGRIWTKPKPGSYTDQFLHRE